VTIDGHYDRVSDIAWSRLEGWGKARVRVDESDSGLVERDRTTGRVIGLEFGGPARGCRPSAWMRCPSLRDGTWLTSDSRRSTASLVQGGGALLGRGGHRELAVAPS
jgi:hypothetical protein